MRANGEIYALIYAVPVYFSTSSNRYYLKDLQYKVLDQCACNMVPLGALEAGANDTVTQTVIRHTPHLNRRLDRFRVKGMGM